MQIKNFGFDWHEPSSFSVISDTIATDCCFILFRSPMTVWTQNGYELVEANTGMLWTPGIKQIYYPAGNAEMIHDFIYINFDAEYEKDIIKDIPVCTPIYFSNTEPIVSTFRSINNDVFANTRRCYKYEILPRLIEILFYRIKNELDFQGENSDNSPHFRKLGGLRNEIYNNVKFDWTLENMSASVHLSPSYFQNLYKQFFFISATNDVIRARVAHAKSMLKYSSLNVSEIAEECGYTNVEHFIRQFKKHTGYTPNKYRKA